MERGATTIWERWDAIAPDRTIYSPEMNSCNHYAYGAVCQWLFEQVAGVCPTADKPGFDEVLLDPQILPRLNPVSMWHQCRHRRIEASWVLEGQRVTYRVTLPSGCQGRLLPKLHHHQYTLAGSSLTLPTEGYLLGDGEHLITFELAST